MWVYFCHAVTLVALLAAVGAAAVYLEIRLAVEKRSLRGLAWLVLASLPAAALTFSFAGDLGAYRYWLPFPDRLRMLASLTSLTSVDSRIRFLAWLLALSLAGLAAWLLVRRLQEKGLGPSDAPLAAVVALLALYFLSPEAMGTGSFITYRLTLFPYLVLILWLATFEHSARRRLGLQVLGAGIALGMLGLLIPRWQEANRYLAEVSPAMERVAPGSTYLPLAFSYGGEAPDGGPVVDRVLPFLHAGDQVSARRTVANLNLFAAGTDAFPIRYRPGKDPYRRLQTRDGWVLSGGGIDYVLVWWPRAREPNLADTRRLLVELEAGYDRVYTSPRDLVRLYRRKKMTQSGCPASARIVPASLIRRKLSSFRRESTTIRREVPRLDLKESLVCGGFEASCGGLNLLRGVST